MIYVKRRNHNSKNSGKNGVRAWTRASYLLRVATSPTIPCHRIPAALQVVRHIRACDCILPHGGADVLVGILLLEARARRLQHSCRRHRTRHTVVLRRLGRHVAGQFPGPGPGRCRRTVHCRWRARVLLQVSTRHGARRRTERGVPLAFDRVSPLLQHYDRRIDL